MAGYTVSHFTTTFENRPTASPDQTIGQVLESTDSSHKPVYVFNGDTFLGVISAYQSIYHNFHAPYTKKVVSELMHTPHITPDSSLYEALRSMMDTRLYELPVVDEENIVLGVITIDSILQGIIHDDMISTYLIESLSPQSAVTRPHEGTVGDVFHLLREKNISRIVLTDTHGKVDGIVSRSDIQIAFFRPVDRQRFRGPAEETRTTLFDSEEIYREDDPIERYSKKNVFTLREDTSKREVIKQLIESEYNSVVLVDRLDKPVGFLSVRDIIHCLATLQPDTDTPIVFQKPDNSVSPAQVEKAHKKIEQMVKKLSKIKPIEKVEVAVNLQKFSTQKVSSYKTSININIPGNNAIATAEDKEYMKSVTASIQQIEKQFMKTSKPDYHKTQASPV